MGKEENPVFVDVFPVSHPAGRSKYTTGITVQIRKLAGAMSTDCIFDFFQDLSVLFGFLGFGLRLSPFLKKVDSGTLSRTLLP